MKKRSEQLVEILKRHNARVTEQRIAVLDAVMRTNVHPTAAEIYDQLKDRFPSMSLATVYNNLRVLTSEKVIVELRTSGDSSRYDYFENGEQHYHAVCRSCGKVVDFSYPELTDVELAAARLVHFHETSHQLEVYGLCDACYQKSHESNRLQALS
ncbi:transcriptional repressor [Atopobacter sp. AH10]|uniref:Fur family transcriptional regulator n=1 Tax=Atopobacter sp. AH10 TaxID=2315861 RepID=UPI000EF19F15|nr:Fur family transcriptional regulator [Atopobacter sp. AH10]RLK63092.1 transcriptional repressor [Atopobacter sp. AH10]